MTERGDDRRMRKQRKAERTAQRSGAAERKRVSGGVVRLWAWTLGALSFLTPFAILGLSPRPADAQNPAASPQAQAQKPKRPVIIIVTKKIIERQAAAPSVSTSGGGGYVSAPAYAAPAPVAVSCGTHPC